MRSRTLVKASFTAASIWMLSSAPTASAVGFKGFGSAIAARFRKGPSSASTPGDTAESLLLAEEERVRAVRAQCCADLNKADGAEGWAKGVKKRKRAESCLADGAECPYHGFHGLSIEPDAWADASMCVDIHGNIIIADTGKGDRATTAIDFSGSPLPPCGATAIDRLCFNCWLWVGSLAICAVVVLAGTLHSARLPLKHGDEDAPTEEDMAYEERLLAVASLLLLCGGAAIMFLVYEAFLLRCMWVLFWTWWVLVPLVLFMVSTAVAMRKLDYKVPNKSLLHHHLFKIWNRYFGFELVYDDQHFLLDALVVEGRQFLIAQMPHAVMPFGAILGMSVAEDAFPGVWPMSGVVASALMNTPVLRDAVNILGVREAGTASILKMFADGFQAIAVITGGIAEMFVSRRAETLTCLRKGFSKIALRGGYMIVPVFVFGVSRTYRLFPLADNRLTRFLSRKIKLPLVAFYGAFGLIPYRRKMKMVIGRPIIVEKASSDVTDDQAQELCDEVQAAVLKLYEKHRPSWETRPARFER